MNVVMDMKRWKNWTVLGVLFILFCIYCYGDSFVWGTQYSHRMFSEISLLDKLKEYEIEDSVDEAIDRIAYLEGFCGEILYKGDRFIVSAYVFPEGDSEKEYLKRVAGYGSAAAEDVFYWEKSGGGLSQYAACYDDKALYIRGNCTKRPTAEFENWLAEDFELEIPDSMVSFDALVKQDAGFVNDLEEKVIEEVESGWIGNFIP